MSSPTTKTISVGGSGGTPLIVKDEGSTLTPSASSLNFAGAGVVATTVGDAVTVTVSGASGSGGATATFTSPQQMIAPNTLVTVAHGLGIVPVLVQCYLVNVLAERGYVPGDIVYVDTAVSEYVAGNNATGITVKATATDLTVIFGVPSHFIGLLDSTLSGSGNSVTPANWRLVIQAWGPIGGAVSGSTSYYTSPLQVITAAGALTLAHSLGTTPILVTAELVNQSAELGYSVNDSVVINLPGFQSPNTNSGLSVVPDATNLNIRFGSLAAVFSVVVKNTGLWTDIDPTKWKIRLRAWGAIGGSNVTGSARFTSTDQTITAAGSLTLAHGLSSTPSLIDVILVNQIGNAGYSPGDLLPINKGQCEASFGTGVAVIPDATNLNIRFAGGSGGTVLFTVIHKTSGAGESIVNADWKIRFIAQI